MDREEVSRLVTSPLRRDLRIDCRRTRLGRVASWSSAGSATRTSRSRRSRSAPGSPTAGGVEREQTEACTRAAFDAGINFFDTSNIYGVGAAESAWGEILKNFRREEFILATKLFFPMDETERRPLQGGDPQADRRLAGAAADRLRRPLPVPPPRPGHPDRGDDGGAHRGGRGRQGPRDRLQRVDRRADRGLARGPEREEVRLLPAAVQHDLAGPRGRADPVLRGARDLADRLVAARPGGADRQVQPGRAAARGLARRLARRWAG